MARNGDARGLREHAVDSVANNSFGSPRLKYRNLTYIHQGTSPKVMRWALALENFAFFLKHVPGKANVTL